MGKAIMAGLVLLMVLGLVWGCGYSMGASSVDDPYAALTVAEVIGHGH